MTKKQSKKPKQMTLFFESRLDCELACDMLGLSQRKVVDLDRKHGGCYSKTTGHYALITKNEKNFRTPIRSKLIIDQSQFDELSEGRIAELKVVDKTNIGWITS